MYFDATGALQYAPNNQLVNSEGVGFVAGSPGTNPASWNVYANGQFGLTRTIATGTINGYNYIDVTWSGTATSSGAMAEDPDLTTTAGFAVVGAVYTVSAYLSVTVNSGVTPNCYLAINERNSAGTLIGGTSVNFSSSTLTRISATRTLNQPTVARVGCNIRQDIVSGNAYNYTIRISQPQSEIGVSSPTAYKPTTGTAYYGPRFDTDPVTLQSRGLLIEESRTNNTKYSDQLDNATWLKNNVTFTPNLIVSPNGGTNAGKVISTITSAAHNIAGSSITSANGTWTFSVFLKAAEYTTVTLQPVDTSGGVGGSFNLSTGVASAPFVFGTWTTPLSSITPVGNGWYRCSITATITAALGSLEPRIYVKDTSTYAGDGTSGIYAWGAQLELGSFPTSYIPTGAATATRAADLAQILGSDFKSFFNQYEGTCVVAGNRALPSGASPSSPRLGEIGGSGQAHNIIVGRGSPPSCTVGATSGNVYSGSVGSNYAENNSTLKAGLIYSFTSGNGSSSGLLGTQGNSGVLNTSVTNLYIGDNGSGTRCFQGCISSIAYYPHRLNDQQLISLTL
jgi:hypothetical protein